MNYQTYQSPNNPFNTALQLPAAMPGVNYASPGSMQGQEAYAQVAPGMNAQLQGNETMLGNEFARALQNNQQRSVLAGLGQLQDSKQNDQAVQNRALGNQMSFLNQLISPLFSGGPNLGLTGKPF